MPVTLRVAFTILGVVTALVGSILLGLAVFMGAWGGWLGLVPLALIIAYTAVTTLVMVRKRWARYATLLFPVSFAVAAASMMEWEEIIPVLLGAVVVTLAAVVLIFAPLSRRYFEPTALR